MNKIINTIIGILLSSSFVLCQIPLNIIHFLETSDQQQNVVFQHKKNTFLNTHSYEIPLIKKLQFRTETNDFDIRQQEYLLRASINDPKKIDKQNQYQQAIRNTSEMDLIFAKTEALKERYDILINIIGLTAILKVKRQQDTLLEDRITLFKRSVALAGFDILDLIEAEDAQQQNEQDILGIESKLFIYKNHVQQLMKLEDSFFLEDSTLINIEKIKTISESIQFKATLHPQLNSLSSKIEEKILAYELEAVKSKFSIAYIQARLSDDSKDNIKEKISIGIGFDIPLKQSNRLNFNKLEFKIIESQSMYHYTAQQVIYNQNILYAQLHHLIQKYDLIQEQLNNNQAVYALEEYKKIAAPPPSALLKLKESTLDKELLLQETRLKLLQIFIDYLHITGILGQQPYQNYLSSDLEHF